jgi:hypothetical protein
VRPFAKGLTNLWTDLWLGIMEERERPVTIYLLLSACTLLATQFALYLWADTPYVKPSLYPKP